MENKILEVEAAEKEFFLAKEILLETLTLNALSVKKSGHESKNCNFRCTKCKIPNHSQRDFWYKEIKEENEANISKEIDDTQVFFLCMSVQQESKSTCYLNSTCKNYLTRCKEFFVSLDAGYTSTVKLGDGKFHASKEKM